jgi:phage terminase large subunit-like protein
MAWSRSCWDLVAYGRENPGDHSFRLVEYAAPECCDLDDEATWQVANPALDDFLHRDGVRATLPPKLRESTFRRYRLGQWTEAVDEPWIAAELWAACADVRGIPDGAEVVIALDRSFSQDCTALVACTVENRPHLDVVGDAADPRSPVVRASHRQRCSVPRAERRHGSLG